MDELYQDDVDSQIDFKESGEEVPESDSESHDSFDFEESMKRDMNKLVNEKLENIESRLNYLFDNHNKECKHDFKEF